MVRKYLIAVFILFLLSGIGLCEADDRLEILEIKGITFKPGLRIQPRYTFDEGTNNNDMMIRRTRLKAEGEAYDKVKYKFEWKLDNVGEEGKTPQVIAETVFIESLFNPAINMRIGLYDAPFSRVALTSDSKLLLIEYPIVYEELKKLGITDNTYGMLLYGRPYKGLIEYSFGVFDNDKFEKETKELMLGGRFVVNLFDGPEVGYADYKGSYIGEGRRLSIGGNYEKLGNITSGGKRFDISAWGIDLFSNYESLSMQAEYDQFEKDIKGYGWYVQGGYLLPLEYRGSKFEMALRYQIFEPDTGISGDNFRRTTIGFNSYINGHNLKIQMAYTFKDEEGQKVANNTFMLQGQLDF